MSDRTIEGFPPLGEPTPGRSVPPTRRWRRRTAVVATGTLLLGLVAGFALGHVVDDGNGRDDSASVRQGVPTTLPRPTTTPPFTVPAECRDAIRSAEQALALLDQGFQSLRAFQIGELETVLAEMQRLRDVLSRRVSDCLEQA